jgi:hypothetical protein
MIDERILWVALFIAGWVLWTAYRTRQDNRKKQQADYFSIAPPKIDHQIIFLPVQRFDYDVTHIPESILDEERNPFLSLLDDMAKLGWELLVIDRSKNMLLFRKVGPAGYLSYRGRDYTFTKSPRAFDQIEKDLNDIKAKLENEK